MVFDGAQLAEGAIHAFGRIEGGIYLVERYAVGDQCEFQVLLGRAAHAPSSGEFFEVKEIGYCGGFFARDILLVVRVYGGVKQCCYATVCRCPEQKILFRRRSVGSRWQRVDLNVFEQTLIAALRPCRESQIDDVPMHIARLNLCADLCQPAVVVFEVDFNACFSGECLVVAFDAGARIRSAPGDHSQRSVFRKITAQSQHRQRGYYRGA